MKVPNDTDKAADPSRRDALVAMAVGSVALVTGCATTRSAPRTEPSAAVEKPVTNSPVLTGSHTVLPLPFNPGSLNGISERMIVSHHDNNYAGAVTNLNKVEKELAQITKDTAPFLIVGLRERELTFRNSKALHETYFDNLGGNGRLSGPIDGALSQAYGTLARWEEHFRGTGMGLGGGSGWVILGLELETGALRTYGSSNHTQTLAFSVPLLVMDMYEHSYQIDYGAAHARYIDAFFTNIHWDEVNRRFERAQRAAGALRG